MDPVKELDAIPGQLECWMVEIILMRAQEDGIDAPDVDAVLKDFMRKCDDRGIVVTYHCVGETPSLWSGIMCHPGHSIAIRKKSSNINITLQNPPLED